MPTPGEHKTVQARILEYASTIGWTFVPREEAERRCGFDPSDPPAERTRGRSMFFDDLLNAKVRGLNPRNADGPSALLGRLRLFHPDVYGNRDFVEHLRNRGKFFDHEVRQRKRQRHRQRDKARQRRQPATTGHPPIDNHWHRAIL